MCGAIFYLVIFQFESYALHCFLCDFDSVLRRPIRISSKSKLTIPYELCVC